jgi:hypothetical protein
MAKSSKKRTRSRATNKRLNNRLLLTCIAVFLLLFTAIGATYLLGSNNPPEVSTTPPSTYKASQSPLTISENLFSKQDFSSSLSGAGSSPILPADYPVELKSIKESDLVGIKCTFPLSKSDQHIYASTLSNKQQEVNDSAVDELFTLLQQSNSNTPVTNVIYCKTTDNRQLALYHIGIQGEYVSEIINNQVQVINTNNKVDGLYFKCENPLMLTKNQDFYLSCTGGDNTIYQIIYKINLNNKTINNVYECNFMYYEENKKNCSQKTF